MHSQMTNPLDPIRFVGKRLPDLSHACRLVSPPLLMSNINMSHAQLEIEQPYKIEDNLLSTLLGRFEFLVNAPSSSVTLFNRSKRLLRNTISYTRRALLVALNYSPRSSSVNSIDASASKQGVDLTSEALKVSKWGTANVNGISLNDALRVLTFDNGYILETKETFGGERLWLPKNSLRILEPVPKTLMNSKRITVISGQHLVLLFSNLADEII